MTNAFIERSSSIVDCTLIRLWSGSGRSTVKRVVSSFLPEFLLLVELEELPEEACPVLSPLMGLGGHCRKNELAVVKYSLQAVSVAPHQKQEIALELKREGGSSPLRKDVKTMRQKNRAQLADKTQKLSTRCS